MGRKSIHGKLTNKQDIHKYDHISNILHIIYNGTGIADAPAHGQS